MSDFGGWATKNDLKCSDGRVIRHGAFSECDGVTVPLVWQHMHNSPENVLGHAELESRNEGVYARCTFNDTPAGQNARELVKHGDIRSLSIYANRLVQRGNEVMHGVIREVSLVLTGANPGALIDNLSFAHDGYEETVDDEAIIYTPGYLYHADDGEPEEDSSDDGDETIEDVFNTLTDKQKNVVYAIIGAALDEGGEDEAVSHADDDGEPEEDSSDDGDETIEDVFNTLTDKQKDAVYAIIGAALDEGGENQNGGDQDEMAQSYYEEGNVMKHNVFDGSAVDRTPSLSHADQSTILEQARNYGSLKAVMSDVFEDPEAIQHMFNEPDAQEFFAHGIENIGVLFPDFKTVNDTPYMITRRMEWVGNVLNATRKAPFSRIRSTAANLTADQARAKGYIKGNEKLEEQISVLQRQTTPQTIYKKQAMDRDDLVDITDFDVVAWLKAEMRMMLDEEIARAILVGDGRLVSDPDKIKEENIRPIWTDAEMFSVHSVVADSNDREQRAQNFVDEVIRARKNYKGSGNPVLYIGTDLLTDMRLLRTLNGERLYKTDAELAADLRVSKIEEIELFDGLSRTVDGSELKLAAILVNLADYTVGATKGGEVNFFDDFDIDFNKEKYLLETRMSGCLTQPMSALVVEFGGTASSGASWKQASPTSSSNPKTSGWYEADENLNYVLTNDTEPVKDKAYYIKH